MNNRIKQLHEEAVIYTASLCGKEHPNGPRPFQEVLDEKFVELLIQEMLKLGESEVARYLDMNERIKELAKQSNAWYPFGYLSAEGGDETWQHLVIFKKENLAKFVELITMECIENIEQFDHHINPAMEVVPTIVDQIKGNFGVEG